MVIEEARYTYPTQLTNSFDRENWTVSTDHCYARPWNWRPEASFLRPTKTLFIPKLVPVKPPTSEFEEMIDIETEVEVPAPNYDVTKAKALMNECEKHAFGARADTDEDWEEKVSRLNWTVNQNKVFNSMVNILNSFNLSKLAHSGSQNEPLLRRTVIDKAVQRVRRLLASVLWEPKLVQWLHQTLIDNLSPQYLGSYLDILQTLKSKLPNFLEKMMHTPSASHRMSTLCTTNLAPLLEKPWDPVSTTLMQDKPKKLPGNPVIIIVPSGPVVSKTVQKWTKLLANLATVVTIQTNFGSTGHRMTIPSILDQLFSMTRAKIQDVKEDYSGKNIILVGFNSGAALAFQIAQIEPVLCVVSIGFSLLTVEGRRGEPDDIILDLQCPVLFVIGQRSNTSTQEDIEDLRERMRVETGLLVVGCADDYLRVNKKKKRQEGITQSIVDRCVVDEIGEFVSGLILSPYPPQIRQPSAHTPQETPVKKGNAERKRYNSNTSSLDSEPPSPTPVRITRPVGRPPGSKTKNRLETKWAQQIAQGNQPANLTVSSPTSPPPYPTTPTPDTSSNDSYQTDKPSQQITPTKQSDQSPLPVKKLKTLKPVVITEKTTLSPVKNQSQSARMQAFSMSRNLIQGNTSVANLLQGGIKTIPPTTMPSTSGIKAALGPKYITAKKQLMVQKPPRPMKRPIYMPASNVNPTLPPPTNLTTQDIMDLPIIFADDNQIINSGSANTSSNATSGISTVVNASSTSSLITQVTKQVTPTKFMLVNKNSLGQTNYILTPSHKKTMPTTTFNKPAPKFTKIILSSKKTNVNDSKTTSTTQALSTEMTFKRVINAQGQLVKSQLLPKIEADDIENHIAASTLHKPSSAASGFKNIKIISKIPCVDQQIKNENVVQKRSFSSMQVEESDPDYVPPKCLKFE